MISRRLLLAGGASVAVLAALRFTQKDVSAASFEIDRKSTRLNSSHT